MSNCARLPAFLALALAIAMPDAARAADTWMDVNLGSGRSNYGDGYRPVSAVRSGDIVTLSGLLKNKRFGAIATLPGNMRPARELIFNVNTHDSSARVDVLPNGEIHMVTGDTKYGWVSLDGISYSVGKPTPLKLENGWRNYGNVFADAGVTLEGDTVLLNGLVKAGNDRVIAKLPPGLRPAKALIFNTTGFDKTARVDVYPDGSVISVYRGSAADDWVSLNGITFNRRQGQQLQLVSGWQNYGQQYAPVTVTRTGERVSVSGLARASSGTWGHIANLPKGMCPDTRLIFSLNNEERSSRIDVLADCRIHWIAGGSDHGWLSLDGISFYLKPAASGGLPTASSGGGTPSRSANATGMIDAAEKMLKSRGDMAGPLYNAINSLIGTYNQMLVEDGELLRADVKVPGIGKTVTVVIYRPITHQPDVNVAVMTKPGESLRVSDFIGVNGGTPADDLQLTNAAYIFVPKENAQDSVNVSTLPGAVRTQVQQVQTGNIGLLAGQNIFATINTSDGGATARLLKLAGADLRNLKVSIGYGRQSDNDPVKAVRLSTADWKKPFHLSDTVFKLATLDLSQWGNVKRLRAWGEATLKNEPYFLYVQKTGEAGPYPTAAAIDAASLSLEDYKNVALILGETVFGSVANGQALINGLNNGLDHLPLNAVRIENHKYTPGGALDADNNPVFDKVLLMAASPADELTDSKRTKGPIIVAHGTGKVFGVPVAWLDAWITKDKGMDIDANMSLPDWGSLKLGSYKFELSKGSSWTSYDMYLRGKASLAAGPVTFAGEDITIEARKTGFTFEFGQQCPRRPIGVKAKVSSLAFGSGPGFGLDPIGNPVDCIVSIGETLDKAASEVANVSKEAYEESRKQVEKELNKIGDQAEKATKWVANKISGLFGKKKKSKPREPSYEELRQLECGKDGYPGYVLWQDECPRNWADAKWDIPARQSSTRPETWLPCATQEDIRRLENEVATLQKVLNSGSRFGRMAATLTYETRQRELKQARELATEKCVTGYSADVAQDRNEDTFSITGTDNNPWWEIDLGKDVPLETVVVHGNKQDPSQLDGVIVAVSATVQGDQLMWDQSNAVKRFILSKGAMSIVDVRDTRRFGSLLTVVPANVRYVRIYRAGRTSLALGEVQIFGTAGVRMSRQ